MQPTSRSFYRRLGIAALILVVTVVGISVVAAQNLPFADGRINQIAFFGGDALYCVDAQYLVSPNLPDSDNGGGFRLLSKTGQALWYIPGVDVTKASEKVAGAAVLVGSWQGSYGPAALYVNKKIDGSIFFIFTGFDDHSKPNSFIFASCEPQGSPSNPSVPTAVPTPIVIRNPIT